MDSNFVFYDYHKFGRILGKGSFGLVVECTRQSDSQLCAIKLIKKDSILKWVPLLDNEVPMEVMCLHKISTLSNVIKIIDYIQPTNEILLNLNNDTSTNDFLVKNYSNQFNNSGEQVVGIVFERNLQEKCFFDYLMEHNYLTECESKLIFRQLIDVNLSLLKLGILHGDLKSENILINEHTKQIKLIDFGSAQFIDCSSRINTKAIRLFMGTDLYKPPEYIMHKFYYPRPSTVWCLGIILHDMVCGYFPFQNEDEILARKDNELNFYKEFLSENLRDLIKRCLAFYAADRISIDKVLAHSWFQ
jgi:serine/threonine protein kinase